jgi:tRNA G18 (ribose-2'-O)-methylase SpoU
VIALEKTTQSKDFRGLKQLPSKLAVVVGNEKTGLSSAIMNRCDQTCHLPMVGTKESLNVGVAGGIFLYYLTFLPE